MQQADRSASTVATSHTAPAPAPVHLESELFALVRPTWALLQSESLTLPAPSCNSHGATDTVSGRRGADSNAQAHFTQTLSPHTARSSVVFSWCRAGAASLVDHVVLQSPEGSWMVRV